MKKTFRASLAALGMMLGGCALAGLQPTPHAGADAPTTRAIAQALLNDRPLDVSAQVSADPERFAASYRALANTLQGE